MFSPLELMRQKLLDAGQAFFLQLPNILVAILLLVAVWFASKAFAGLIKRVSIASNRPDLGSLLGSLARVALIIIARGGQHGL